MKYGKYLELNQEIDNKYNEQKANFPLAFAVLETELRNEMAGYFDYSKRNLRALSKHHTSIDIIINLLSQKYKSSGSIYLELPGFTDLKELLNGEFNADYNIYSKKIFKHLSTNKLLHKIGVQGAAFPEVMQHAFLHGVETTLNNKNLLAKLNKELSRNKERQKIFIKNNNIKIFISTNDSKPFARILIQSARDLKIPYVTICHGYVTNPYLITVAPLNSDKLVLWSDQQVNDIRHILPERDGDIVTFGNPKAIEVNKDNSTSDTVLAAWEPLYSGLSEEERNVHFETINFLKNIFEKSPFKLIFKPHPKEQHLAQLIEKITTIGLKIESEKNTSNIIKRSSAVIAPNTSVLVDAAALGIKSVQIKNLAKHVYEGSTALNLNEIYEYVAKDHTDFKACSESRLFKSEKFIGWIKNMLT